MRMTMSLMQTSRKYKTIVTIRKEAVFANIWIAKHPKKAAGGRFFRRGSE